MDGLAQLLLAIYNSEQSATSVQGHYAQTLDETVRIKASQVGEYGEGYRVGLEASTGKQTGRGTVVEVAPQQATAAPTAVRGQTPRLPSFPREYKEQSGGSALRSRVPAAYCIYIREDHLEWWEDYSKGKKDE
ncbi:uncharacterized protein PITG_17795 [Phytophthora infestans T30-4]|uniref:Uncharacterized protein n=1 Tax=Phytophthora infestans (strain T30-4) TaxID=403677 RepID=D0NWA5_PHYIT|nr:uncharacterized protein PITG_17795 [Phytophthora infestans T30-4]EEY66922.1 hypothetical protein PITG_17795 [Phytophthora infestans T30-4]|eukprot:XP_002896640.1 hypothetical protein PITG_17795 [Phytophthora infestans T30-4]